MTIELNPITSGYSTGLINDNFQAIEDYVNDKLLQRDGVETGEVNQMEVDLDMNSHFVYNLPEPVLEHQAARLQDVQNAVAGGAANLITFTPYGSITSENVQGAIQELEDQAAQDPNTFEVDTETGTQTLQDALNSRATEAELATLRSDSFLEANLTVNIPTDYATIQEAIDDLSTLSVKQGVVIDISIEAGHQPASGVLVEDGNYSHFYISSVDAEVTLDPTFPAVDIIKGVNARMPVLNCLINANSLGVNGYFADQGSSGFVTSGSGIKFCNRQACYANAGSRISADDTVWTNASQEAAAYSGILAWSSQISAQGADVSNSGYYGAQGAAGGTLNFRDGIADGAVRHGVRATNAGLVNARGASAQNCGVTGFRCFDGSHMHATGSNATGSNDGYYCEHSSILNASSSTALNCPASGYTAINGGIINAENADASGSGNGFRALSGATLSCENGTANNCTVRSIASTNGSRVYAGLGTYDGSLGSETALVDGGSTLSVRSASLQNSAGIAITADELSQVNANNANLTGWTTNAVEITKGSQVEAFGTGIAPADTNVGSFNAIAGIAGIIWA